MKKIKKNEWEYASIGELYILRWGEKGSKRGSSEEEGLTSAKIQKTFHSRKIFLHFFLRSGEGWRALLLLCAEGLRFSRRGKQEWGLLGFFGRIFMAVSYFFCKFAASIIGP